MAFIDERGRLFGRLNLIDAAAVVFVAVLVPLGYAAYRVFRVPPPVITSVSPQRLSADGPRRIRLTGRNLRPYLGAFVAKTGEPYSVVNRLPDTMQATFLIETPNLVELVLPPLAPGTYDIHVYDEAQEVASRTSAFTVTPPEPARIEALVRFVVPAETAAVIQDGDHDRWEQHGVDMFAEGGAATIGSVRETLEPAEIESSMPGVTASAPGVALQATVMIPAKGLTLGGWEYKSQRVRAGETLIFETDRYRIVGTILRIAVMAETPSQGGG